MALSLTDIFLAQRSNTTYYCTLEDILSEFRAGNTIVCNERPEGPHCEGTLWYNPTDDNLYVYLCAGTNCGKGHGGCFEPTPLEVCTNEVATIDADGNITPTDKYAVATNRGSSIYVQVSNDVVNATCGELNFAIVGNTTNTGIVVEGITVTCVAEGDGFEIVFNSTTVGSETFIPASFQFEGCVMDNDGDICDFVLVTNDGTLTIATHGEEAEATNTFSANEANDVTITLPQIRYEDLSGQPTVGAGDLTIQSHGQNAAANVTFNANESSDVTMTLPQIRYQDLSGQPTIGNAQLTIATYGGTNATNTFTANATSNVTITLPQISYGDLSNLPSIGNGALVIQAYNNSGASSTGSYTANQTGSSTITLPQIRYGDLSGRPSIGNGTISIVQPGAGTQTFTVNQTGNTTITLKNDNTVPAVGNGAINVNAGNGITASGSNATANQSGATTRTLTAKAGDNTITVDSAGIKVNKGNLGIPSVGNGAINVNAGNGLSASGSNATANQSSATTRTLSAKAGDNTITVDSAGIKVNKGNLGIPSVGNGAINVNAGNGLSASGSNATANQSGATTRTLSAKAGDNTITVDSAGIKVNKGNLGIPSVGNATITLRSYGENVNANSTFTTNQSSNETITLPQIRYSDLKGKPTLLTGNFIKKDADDTVTGHTQWQDNYNVRLGTGADFRMVFNGKDTVFRNYGHADGDIIFQGENTSGTNQNLFIMKTDTSRTYSVMYENSGERLRTTSGGIKVTSQVEATGNIIAFTSDIRLKKDIEPIKNALEKVQSLRGFTYSHNETAKELGFMEGRRWSGVSAQEVEKVLPEAVFPAPVDNKYLTVQYEKLVPLLIESIKELSEEVQNLKDQVNQLRG